MAKLHGSRRGALHRRKPREEEYEAHKTSWESKARLRGVGVLKMRQQPFFTDGRKLVRYLDALQSHTGDGRFSEFKRVIERYGLTSGSPTNQLKTLSDRLRPIFSEFEVALEDMCIQERDAKKKNKHFSASAAAARTADEYALPGPSFEKTVERLRKAFGRLDKTWRFQHATVGLKRKTKRPS
jgi:hypothetical protein